MVDEPLPSKIYLIDNSIEIVEEWSDVFSRYPEVEVLHGDYFQQPADAIVSPANSFGIMDGGLDLAIRNRLGHGVQARVQEVITSKHHGELPVGCAEVVPTGVDDWCYLVAAPTMRVPERVAQSINAYLAFRAVMIAIENRNDHVDSKAIDSLVCCGLCTGVGAMPPKRAAAQMEIAYKSVLLPASIGRFESIHAFHRMLHQAGT